MQQHIHKRDEVASSKMEDDEKEEEPNGKRAVLRQQLQGNIAFAKKPTALYVPHLGEIPTRQPPVNNRVAIVRFGMALIDKGTEADKAL